MGLLEAIDSVLGIRKKAKSHKLKWKLLEERLTVPVEDADEAVGRLKNRLHAKFVGGGEYAEVVHSKQFGDGVFGYLLVRTDKKTEEETVVAETYMLQEEDRLGVDVTSAYKFAEDLKQMGYGPAFEREFRAWWFRQLEIGITVYDIDDFGAFVEFGLPATNFPKQREASEKKLFAALQKLGFKKEDAIPTDVITLQLTSTMQEEQERKGRRTGFKI